MKTSLFKDLARSGWHSSIMTTYSVDPAFYDGSIEYRLRTYGCENNILMADAVMLKRALIATPEAFKNAGRRYALAPIQVSGCFHPKVHLRLGTDRARLIIGSANATAAGWGSNQEIFTAIDWSRRGESPTATMTGPLIRKAYDYLEAWLAAIPGDALDFKLHLHRKDSPWLGELQSNSDPIELPDGSAIDLFCERGDGTLGFLSRLSALTAGEKAKRLVVISPYWDNDLSALQELRSALSHCPTIIALNPAKNEFPIDAIDAGDLAQFAAVHDDEDAHRFLHAKVILIETDVADHLLFGSANCSDEALGSATKAARNAEVSVYRRFPPGRGLDLLGLDLGNVIDRGDIRRPAPDSKMFESGHSAVPAGTIEAVERSFTWWPPKGKDASGANILLTGGAFPVNTVGNGQHRVHLPFDPVFPVIVRVRFGDGRVSDPIVVHDETALRLASPGVTDRRLRSAFNRVLAGEEDIIDLALQAHLLFAPDESAPTKQGHATERAERASSAAEPKEYETPDEFRRAVARRPGTGESGRFSLDDPGLLDLLAIILRGVTDVGGKEARKKHDEEEDRDLHAGETEDGDEINEVAPEDATSQPVENTGPSSTTAEERVFTPADIERRRRQLLKAMAAFENMLLHLTEHPKSVSNRLTAQTAFILNLMLFACTKEHRKPDGGSVKLMAFAPDSTGDRELTFAVRAGRLLQQIWGGGRNGALVDHLSIDPRHSSMPDDVFFLIVMSRWAIARAFLSASATSARDKLSTILQESAVKIYRSTLRFGPLDADAEQRFVERLDASLGFPKSDTSKLIEHCRRFADAVGAR